MVEPQIWDRMFGECTARICAVVFPTLSAQFTSVLSFRAIPCSIWHAPWYATTTTVVPSMPWDTYAKLSPQCQLYCRYLLLGEEEDSPDWDPPAFVSQIEAGAGKVQQTVARL
jgi:hypothetical protein